MCKKTIGRIDRANFPELNFQDIPIKIDTGAYTSSIHCTEIEEKDGKLNCVFIAQKDSSYNEKKITFASYKKVIVKSSNGIAQDRYVIESTIELFGNTYKISLSLNDRNDMKFPVLIGRKFLNGKFIVDPALENISAKVQKTSS